MPNPTCPECRIEMQAGFMPDYGRTQVFVTSWLAGAGLGLFVLDVIHRMQQASSYLGAPRVQLVLKAPLQGLG